MENDFKEFLDKAISHFAEKNWWKHKEDIKITYIDFNGASGNVTIGCLIEGHRIDTERFKV